MRKTRNLLVLLFVNQNCGLNVWTSLKIVESLKQKGSIRAWSQDCIDIQVRIFPVEPDILRIGHPLVSMSYSPTLENTSSRISIVPSCLVVIGTRAGWMFTSSCLWDNGKLQAARGTYWEPIVISWTRSFTVRATEAGRKSRDHSKPSLETEKVMLLYCRLEFHKMRMERNFWLTVSENGWRHDYAINVMNFLFFWFSSGCACLWFVDNFPQRRKKISIF